MNIGDQAERSAQEEELRQQQRRMELAQALQGQMAQSQGYAQNSGALGSLGMMAQGFAGSDFAKDLKGLLSGGGLV